MGFISNAEDVARSAMASIDPSLTDKYAALIQFLISSPTAASALRGKNAPSVGSEAYIRKQAESFKSGRGLLAPKLPSTVPDEMVSFILHHYFDVSEDRLENVKHEHLLSMAAENLVGGLLERYLASAIEPHGWIWCSGSMIRAVDFIKPPHARKEHWRLLQVKNRDNSENSSSSAIRGGTTIEKWFRTFSRKPGSNWAAFPDVSLRSVVSEDGFRAFVESYLHNLREANSKREP
jgi:hypothetical protein